MDKLSVRDRQIEVATSMINLNSDWQADWKFIIYDSIGENIIAPLFSVEELNNHNIVLHLPINSKRDPVPDVSAVYFVMPTDQNIDRICMDLNNRLYDSYYFNFISPISRSKLETIANASLLSDSASNVKKIYDQYLNFIALEDDFFILRESEKHTVSYHAINQSDVPDSEISKTIDYIVEGLFSLIVTLNIIPIIRCSKGGAAESVAEKLCKKIRETLRDSRNNLFASNSNSNRDSRSTNSTLGLSFQRTLLCLVDRAVDMSTPLHHTWTYQALIHDLLNTELNKVKVVEDKNKPKPKVQIFDLNPKDKFWREERGNPFPQVAEAVQKELDDYKKHEDELTKDLKNQADEITMLESTAKLTSAVSSLPELRENKRVIEKHTTIATAVLDEIKARKLDNFFEIEEKIMNRNLVDRVVFDEMISNPEYGQLEDKYRLFLIAYICDNPRLTDAEADKYADVLESLGCKKTAFAYVKSWKTFSMTNVASLQSSLQSSGGVLETASMFSKLMSQGSQFVMAGVKNLVLKEHFLPLTKIVDSLMDNSSKSGQTTSDYLYLDPKVSKDNEVTKRAMFQNAIVFVVGGGNYIEYQNLVEYCKSKSVKAIGVTSPRHVIYGSTSLMNANQFLQQLELTGDVY